MSTLHGDVSSPAAVQAAAQSIHLWRVSIAWLATFVRSQLLLGRKKPLALSALLLLATTSIFCAFIVRLHPVTHDAFHEMSLVREWLTTGQFPLRDVFAYTPTISPTVHHEWATGLVLYLAVALTGGSLQGIALLKWMMIVALGAMLYRAARASGGNPIVIAILAPIVFPFFWVGFATMRAGLFTLVAIAAQWLMQQSDLRGKRGWVLLWIPMYLVWLNLHAGFVVGIGMLGLHGLERWVAIARTVHPTKNRLFTFDWIVSLPLIEILRISLFRLWHLYLLIPVVMVGLLCNPWGIDYGPYLVRAISMPRPTIQEWRPLWFTYDPVTTLVAFGLSLVLLFYAAGTRRWSRCFGWFICLLSAYMALKHIRHGAIYGALWIAIVPAWLSHTPLGHWLVRSIVNHDRLFRRASIGVTIAAILFIAWQPALGISVPSHPDQAKHCYPVGAVHFLKQEGFRGNLMTPFHVGAYVSWELYPEVLVSLDGRYEVAYQEEVLPWHNNFYTGKSNWQEAFDSYPTDAILIPKQSPVYRKIALWERECRTTGSPRPWEFVYEDAAFGILRRTDYLSPAAMAVPPAARP